MEVSGKLPPGETLRQDQPRHKDARVWAGYQCAVSQCTQQYAVGPLRLTASSCLEFVERT